MSRPFANVRRDVWLRSLPCRAPKDSPRYQQWHAANLEAQRHANSVPRPPQVCVCGCGVSFVPRYRNAKYRPECMARRTEERLKNRKRGKSALRAELQRRSA